MDKLFFVYKIRRHQIVLAKYVSIFDVPFYMLLFISEQYTLSYVPFNFWTTHPFTYLFKFPYNLPFHMLLLIHKRPIYPFTFLFIFLNKALLFNRYIEVFCYLKCTPPSNIFLLFVGVIIFVGQKINPTVEFTTIYYWFIVCY